jgi:hypothetical protein
MGWLRGAAVALVLGSVAGCGDDGSAGSDDDAGSLEVSSDCGAVEITGSAGGATRVPPEPDVLTDALALSFCADFTMTGGGGAPVTWGAVVASEDATCIARELVGRLGEPEVRALGFTRGPWDLLTFALSNPAIDRTAAEQVADSFRTCSDDWKLLLITSVTAGAREISDASAACVSTRLDDAAAREVLVSEIDRAYDDPSQPDATPYPQNVEPLVAAMDACLEPAELDALDWN